MLGEIVWSKTCSTLGSWNGGVRVDQHGKKGARRDRRCLCVVSHQRINFSTETCLHDTVSLAFLQLSFGKLRGLLALEGVLAKIAGRMAICQSCLLRASLAQNRILASQPGQPFYLAC